MANTLLPPEEQNLTPDQVEALDKRHLTVFARIDHAAGAKDAGMDLRPTAVVIFGSAKAGTPLMQADQAVGIDLPLKALVWQDDQDKVWLTYNSAEYLGSYIYPRHGLSLPPEAIKNLEQLLSEISNQATE